MRLDPKTITDLWADDVRAAAEFTREMSILVVPAYPHRRRWQWWHNQRCLGCRLAEDEWPAQRQRFTKTLRIPRLD
jgi:hypothetical protein